MLKQEAKTIHCAKCNAVLLKTDEKKLGYAIIKCKECGGVNQIKVKKVYLLEVEIL